MVCAAGDGLEHYYLGCEERLEGLHGDVERVEALGDAVRQRRRPPPPLLLRRVYVDALRLSVVAPAAAVPALTISLLYRDQDHFICH